MTDGRIEVGRIGAPNGVRGWLKVQSFMAQPEDLFERRDWSLRFVQGAVETLQMTAWRRHGDGWIAKFDGIDERNGAARLTGALIEIDRASLPPAGEHEYYLADLLGMVVRNRDGAELGVVGHFVTTPGNDVMVVCGEREHWVPVTAQHFLRVDQLAKLIEVDWPAEF